MKTANLRIVEKQSRRTKHKSLDKMEAIADGVQARFEENTSYSRVITEATINVARALGVSEGEIERWAAHRSTRLAHDTERLREIKSLLQRLYKNSPSYNNMEYIKEIMRYQPITNF